jgi:hypothetical protein
MPGGGREAPAQSPGAQSVPGGGDRQSPSQSSPTQRGQDKQGQGQQGQREQRGQKDQTTGQAPQGQKDQQKDQKAQGRDNPNDKSQTQQRGQRDRDQTTGQNPREQGQRDQGQSPSQTQRDQSPTQQGQSPQRQQGQAPQGQAEQGRSGGGGSVNLTTEQRTKIRQTVLVGNAPRASNVNFSLTVGTAVPTSVRVVAVPPTLIEIYPAFHTHIDPFFFSRSPRASLSSHTVLDAVYLYLNPKTVVPRSPFFYIRRTNAFPLCLLWSHGCSSTEHHRIIARILE